MLDCLPPDSREKFEFLPPLVQEVLVRKHERGIIRGLESGLLEDWNVVMRVASEDFMEELGPELERQRKLRCGDCIALVEIDREWVCDLEGRTVEKVKTCPEQNENELRCEGCPHLILTDGTLRCSLTMYAVQNLKLCPREHLSDFQ